MKIVLSYYSGSGNTLLVCTTLARLLAPHEVTFFDITGGGRPDFKDYDVAGFATFADFGGVPQLMKKWIESISEIEKMPAFVVTTYGMLGGKTPLDLAGQIRARGFWVINGYALHTPENYPPLMVKGFANTHAPGRRDLEKFSRFASTLFSQLQELEEKGDVLQKRQIKVGLLNRIIPIAPRKKASKEMGHKYTREDECIKCGRCVKECPYKAISLEEFPVFDEERCYGCWHCYHVCPEGAIYTDSLSADVRYIKPLPEFVRKMEGVMRED